MISVILCTYNGEKYIKKQIDSILMQSVCPDEIIICDDNSTDRTCEIINNINDKRIILHCNKNNYGVTRNFSNGLMLCNGEYIFLSDQDDVWEHDKVEKMLRIFQQNKDTNLIFTDAYLIDEMDRQIGKTLWDSINFNPQTDFNNELGCFLGKRYVTGATVAIRHSFVEEVMPIPDPWIHDAWLAICASISRSIYCYDYKSIGYRQHSNNVIGCQKKHISEKIRERISGDKVKRDEFTMLRRFESFYERFENKLSKDEKVQLECCINFWKDVNKMHSEKKLKAIALIARNIINGRYQKYYTGINAAVGDFIMIFGKG